MKKETIELFNNFLRSYDPERKDEIWAAQSKIFREFWNTKIMSHSSKELEDAETDSIIRILDRNGKGNTKLSEAVAKAMIAQGAWRRLFNELKNNKNLSETVNSIFSSIDPIQRAEFIDKLYKLNKEHKNNLTGQSGNAINTMLAAWDPVANLSVISQKDRRRIIEFFEIECDINFDSDSIGKKIAFSNAAIVNAFKSHSLNYSARTISVFFYSEGVREMWKSSLDEEHTTSVVSAPPKDEEVIDNPALFYMESQLEDFLIENWDKTELGGKYDLIQEDGELVSQQYPTKIGRIDILAQDRNTKQLVVIELKKNQTSDDTVGQLARYMGWLEENKTGGKPTKGIIIAAQYDDRLYYALKKIKDAEVYLYQVSFKLKEFSK